ncbi:unnamed protein product, partial [Didymodactylos carnosus]
MDNKIQEEEKVKIIDNKKYHQQESKFNEHDHENSLSSSSAEEEENENSAEQQFINYITSHLSDHLTVEERSDYLQKVLSQWRKHRKHTQEEQQMYKKYIKTIKENYLGTNSLLPSVHPLYQFQNWKLNPKLIQAINENNFDSVLVQVHPGIYTFECFDEEFCQQLIAEINHFEKWCLENGIRVQRPNSMNNYGAILDNFGFEPCLQDLMTHIVEPLAKHVYSYITPPLDSHHGFVVEYSMNKDKKLDFHVDNADVTLNVCLGQEFTGGQLYFGGVRCQEHVQTPSLPNEDFYFDHKIGYGVLHVGKHRHRACEITSGTRLNLILWVITTTSFL